MAPHEAITHDDIELLFGRRHVLTCAAKRANRDRKSNSADINTLYNLPEYLGNEVLRYYSQKFSSDNSLFYIGFLMRDWALILNEDAQLAMEEIMEYWDEQAGKKDPDPFIPEDILELALDILIFKKFAPEYMSSEKKQHQLLLMPSLHKCSFIKKLITRGGRDIDYLENIFEILSDFADHDFHTNIELFQSSAEQINLMASMDETALIDDICNEPNSNHKYICTGLMSRIFRSDEYKAGNDMEWQDVEFDEEIMEPLFEPEYQILTDNATEGQTIYKNIDVDTVVGLAAQSVNTNVAIPIFEQDGATISKYHKNWGSDIYRKNAAKLGYEDKETGFVHGVMLDYSNRIIDAFKDGRAEFPLDAKGQSILLRYQIARWQCESALNKRLRLDKVHARAEKFHQVIKKARRITNVK